MVQTEEEPCSKLLNGPLGFLKSMIFEKGKPNVYFEVQGRGFEDDKDILAICEMKSTLDIS